MMINETELIGQVTHNSYCSKGSLITLQSKTNSHKHNVFPFKCDPHSFVQKREHLQHH